MNNTPSSKPGSSKSDSSKPAASKSASSKSARQAKRERQRERRLQKEQEMLEIQQKKRRRRMIVGWSIVALITAGVLAIVFLVQQSDDGDESAEIVTEAGGGTGTETTAATSEDTTSSTDLTESTEPEGTEPSPSDTTIIDMPTYSTYTESDYGTGECPPEEVPSPAVLEFSDAPRLCLDPAQEYEAVFTTSEGVIKVRLDTENTPGTANNFYVLAKYGYYNGTLLFRTDPSIGIIQGGAPNTNSPADPGPGYTIKDEGENFTYVPGQLVMARTGAPNSAGAQFFFAVNDSTSLLDGQGTYVVFGNTTEGLDVLEAILDLHVDDPESSLGGGPSRDVVVESIEISPVS